MNVVVAATKVQPASRRRNEPFVTAAPRAGHVPRWNPRSISSAFASAREEGATRRDAVVWTREHVLREVRERVHNGFSV